MSKIKISLPDSSILEFDHEPTVLQVAEKIGPRLAQATLAAKINGSTELIDLRSKLHDGDRLQIITAKDKESNEIIRHSAAHVMAEAVQSIWSDVKVTIGPIIEDGFYYDFDSPRSFSEEDLLKIEAKMSEIIKRNQLLERQELPVDEAISVFEKLGEKFKVEIISDLKAKGEKTVFIYKQGTWFDLCRGPHVQTTGQIKAFKLLSVAGAYWRGDEKREQLQRIYATAFPTKQELDEYVTRIEEAKKRDHRKLGKELGLFHFHPWAPGSPFFLPAGTVIYNELQKFMREVYIEFGYKEVVTPQVYDVELYRTSGHLANYEDNMFFTEIDERRFSMKPMNCPGHCLMYQNDRKSYRDLPWRIADFGRLHRYERSGALHGLTRVRTFCQDDAHIFCTIEQLHGEIQHFMRMIKKVYSTLGMNEYTIFLSTRPEKRMGADEIWDKAEEALASGLKALDIPFTVNPGDGAFYGPKLDIMFVDALKRNWQLGTLQCDFNMPQNFGLTYVGEDNSEHQPVMLHRAILGTLERFIGVYIEHCAGRFPTWLMPTQAIILNVTDRVNEYCEQIHRTLMDCGVRSKLDQRNEKLNYKIREAQMQKIPYMIVVGDKEAEQKTISVRLRDGSTKQGLTCESLVEIVTNEIKERRLESPLIEK